MARYQFKLPDIGEGIAEAEIVAWHIKVGDAVEEDQPIADMMTDKATVEMESPVSGRVVKLAGEVGDQVPIGSVLVVFETDADAPAEAEPAVTLAAPDEPQPEGKRADAVAFTDGLVEERPQLAEAVPSTGERSRANQPLTPSEVDGPTGAKPAEIGLDSARQGGSTSLDTNGSPGK
jgi:2-oxoisovalerate dehydrogenase E2 component (dihydrolipoyl transacylase)